MDRTSLVSGVFYQAFLEGLHRKRNPANYFEVGTLHGHTLSKASCRSVAVDPHFRITERLPTDCKLFEQTSDEFFATQDLVGLLGGPVQLAFLDGMHLFEFLLRDFINTERQASPRGMIVLHDCLPPDIYMTVRDPDHDPEYRKSAHPGWWTGDVWKLVPTLWQYRADLTVDVYDCPGTGLVTVTGLDPQSTILADNYEKIVARNPQRLDHAAFDRYWGNVRIKSSAEA